MTPVVFGPDSKHTVYAATNAWKRVLVVDGIARPLDGIRLLSSFGFASSRTFRFLLLTGCGFDCRQRFIGGGTDHYSQDDVHFVEQPIGTA